MSIANENRRLREIIQQLLDRIDENQKVLSHFQTFELMLLDVNNLHSLFNLLLDESCRHFRLASASLLLLDEDASLEALLDNSQVGNFHNRLQLRQNPDFYHKLYPSEPRVMLQEVDVLTATRLFPGAPKVGSAAFLPIIFQHRLIGSLHFASSEVGRFTADKNTDLLDHFAAVTSVSIQHCLEREARELQEEIDPQSQLGSERYFRRALERELERTARNSCYLACVTVDLTGAELIAGALLVEVAQAVRGSVRKVDICGLIKPNQLAVLMPDSDSRQALAAAGRINKALLAVAGVSELDIRIGANAWKSRKSKVVISPEKLQEAGVVLLEGALTNGKRVAE
ncbi:DUF484 family protein [Halioxenophilus sp. WMMB6]|uniref:DUF484 family protein n=1 Tax=Halioxenophilus sp. WMMB6 TaxID=3073815 RepID=UPI00295F1C07|nr:DUF484 family protein [Halioxenophilus sp. WMMB6]